MDNRFEISNPSANQVLIYDEISGKFINEDSSSVLPPSVGIQNAINMGDEGISVFDRVVDNEARFRTLKAGSQIRLRNMHSYIEIDFAGDAYTFRGKEPRDFLAVENHLSEIDVEIARDNLDVYSKEEAHDQFMETNASNVPDKDDTYDLGSNGRRYADIYAVTFHGTATRALVAESILSYGAEDGDLLSWNSGERAWRPTPEKTYGITDLSNVENTTPRDGDILQYNHHNRRWEFVEYLPFTGFDDGMIVAINSTGNGLPIIRSRIGDIVELRSIRAGTNINIATTNFDNEILINAEVPQNTDDLPEGVGHLYYTDERVQTVISGGRLQDIGDISSVTPVDGQGLVWDESRWVLRDLPYNMYSTDDLSEGSENLYFTTARAINVFNDMVSSGSIKLSDLSDVNTYDLPKSWLYYNGMNWVNKEVYTDDVKEGTENLFHTEDRVVGIIEDQLSKGNILLKDLGDTDVEPEDGDFLVHDGDKWTSRAMSYPRFDNYRMTSAVSTSTINFETANIHRIDGTVNQSISLVGNTPSDEGINVIIFIEGYGGNITWPSDINWNNNSIPTLGASWTNIILFWTGSMWIGMLSARG